VDIPKHPGGKPETIRVSALPMRQDLYADVRVHLREHPTGQGLVVHRDLIADVIAGLQEVCGGGGLGRYGGHRTRGGNLVSRPP